MKCLSFLLLLVLLISPARGQDDESMDAPRKGRGHDGKAKKDLGALPRDEHGFLKAEVWDMIKATAAANPGGNEAGRLATRPDYQAFYATYAKWKAPEPPAPPAGKLSNLSETPKEPRFPLTDKVWPTRVGEASVCLWEDDKLAAMTLGVDDNNAMDLPYWKGLEKKYGKLNITWNLIVCGIESNVEKGRASAYGTWKTWQQMVSEGYHVSSHSMCHNHDPVPSDGWPGPDWEAAESQRLINAHIPGFKAKLFARPGAGVPAFSIVRGSWDASIKKYYAGARDGGRDALNEANMIDYFHIHSTTGNVPAIVDDKDTKVPDQNLNNLFAADPKHPYHKYYRGWANVFIHFIGQGKAFDTQAHTVAYGKVLAFYNTHRADLWTGFIDDVALYGQERDTATLKTDGASDAKIQFTLTSKMDPSVFNYPLTIKVRLPTAWKGAVAQQNNVAVPVAVITHEGALYALVKAVPDRGQVTLTPAAAK